MLLMMNYMLIEAMTKEEQYLLNRWQQEWKCDLSMTNKNIIFIDKSNNKSYLILCKGKNLINILKKSKKHKNIISQFKDLFPEKDFSLDNSCSFKFIHLFENNIENEIIFGIKNNQISLGGFGIYEI